MTEPLYAYRSYVTFPSNLVHCSSDQAGLLPLFFQYEDWDGTATDSSRLGTARPAHVDLFDWTHADEAPEIGDPDNWVQSYYPKPHNEYVNLHDPGADKGLYAFKTLELSREYIRNLNWKPTVVFAKVQLAGVVVEHENGYRAQKTRIVELYCESTGSNGLTSDADRDLLASRLGWPFGITAL